MKYFTAELWAQIQDFERGRDAVRQWGKNAARYEIDFDKAVKRVSKQTATTLRRFPRHDGYDLRIEINQDFRQHGVVINLVNEDLVMRPNGVDGVSRTFALTFNYRDVLCCELKHPEVGKLFQRGEGLGNWGYDELLPSGKDNLLHNILLDSGVEIVVVCGRLQCAARIIENVPGRFVRCEASGLKVWQTLEELRAAPMP